MAEAETERFLLFEAVTGLLAAASRERPLVLVLDDLHWAGAPEVLLLKHLVRSSEPMRVLVIGTYRDTDLARTHPLTAALADLRREVGVERLALHGLDDAAVEALVVAAARHELDERLVALAHAIRRETEGNPFFIGEVIRHLAESGALFQEDGRWTYRGEIAGLGIPEGVREVIGRRLGRLAEPTARILGLAAVIGRQFDVGLLARVAEASEDAVLDALDDATAAALVAEVRGSRDEFAFRHALIRTTLYEELSASRRARLHRRVGEALEALVSGAPGARIEELAHHWLAATRPADAGKAIGYARQAGERALARLAFEEAAAHVERALGVLEPRGAEDERLRCDLLLALGDAQRRAGDTRYREPVARAVEVARALGDADRLALAALASARPGGFMASANVVDEALIALYEEALAGLGAADSLLRARLLGQLAVELVYTPQDERRDALSREAAAMARRCGDRSGLGQVLILRLIASNNPFTLAERLALTAELAALAREAGSIELAWHAAFHRAGALLESGDITGAEDAVDESERLAAELRQPFYIWIAGLMRGMLLILRGDPDAERQARVTFELAAAGGQPDAAAAFGAQLNSIRLDQGRAAEMIDALRALTDAMPHISSWRSALAGVYSECDRLDDVREQIEALRVAGFDHALDWAWGAYMMDASTAVCAVADTTAAAVLYERLCSLAPQVQTLLVAIGSNGSYGFSCGRLAACLSRWDDAEGHFADALAMNERLGARPWVVRTRRAWAAMRLARGAPGDTARARDLVAAALPEAETLGMAREIERLRQLADTLAAEG